MGVDGRVEIPNVISGGILTDGVDLSGQRLPKCSFLISGEVTLISVIAL